MGDKVRIKVVAANLTKRQLDYEWVITSAMNEDKKEGKPATALKPERGVIPPKKTPRKRSKK
jgi:ribonuclease R